MVVVAVTSDHALPAPRTAVLMRNNEYSSLAFGFNMNYQLTANMYVL